MRLFAVDSPVWIEGGTVGVIDTILIRRDGDVQYMVVRAADQVVEACQAYELHPVAESKFGEWTPEN